MFVRIVGRIDTSKTKSYVSAEYVEQKLLSYDFCLNSILTEDILIAAPVIHLSICLTFITACCIILQI